MIFDSHLFFQEDRGRERLNRRRGGGVLLGVGLAVDKASRFGLLRLIEPSHHDSARAEES